MNKLHIDSILKVYNNRQILTDVFISCTPGEIIGLLGRNVSGKSTLLKIVFGSLLADRKFVKVGDKLMDNLAISHHYIKYLPQENFLPKHIRLKEIIPLFCTKDDAALLIKNEHIKPLLYKKGGQFSGGEIRLAEILLLIYSDAEFVLMDEPFNGISPIWRDEIKHHIRLQSAKKGFILTDHDYRNILDISTKTILLYDGGTKYIQNNKELEFLDYLPGNKTKIPKN